MNESFLLVFFDEALELLDYLDFFTVFEEVFLLPLVEIDRAYPKDDMLGLFKILATVMDDNAVFFEGEFRQYCGGFLMLLLFWRLLWISKVCKLPFLIVSSCEGKRAIVSKSAPDK